MRDRHSLLSNTTNEQTATMHGQPSVTVRHEDLRVVATANHHSFGGLLFTSADRHQRPGRVQLASVGAVPADDRDRDHELAAAAARGDRAALDELLRRHSSMVHAVCRRVLANPEDALDATQEALISIARRIDTFDGRSKFSTWCYRVATNAALDEARRRSRRPAPVEIVAEPRAGGPALDDAVADQLDIDAALAHLSPEYRAAVALRDLAGLDYADIASILGIPPGTVRSRIARGRAALADRLAPREIDGNQTHPAEHPKPRSS